MRFITAHSELPAWGAALEQVVSRVAAARARPDTITRPNLGLVYATEAHAGAMQPLLAGLRARTGVNHWVGGVGAGIAVDGQEYWSSPALGVMLLQIPMRDFRVFSGMQPLAPASGPWRGAHSALVHGDPEQPEMDDLVRELAARTASGQIWGGLVSSKSGLHIADGVFRGGLSGVAFSSRVPLAAGLTQDWEAFGPERVVTRCNRNVVYALDGEPALAVLLGDLGEPACDAGGCGLGPPELQRLAPRLREVMAGLSHRGEAMQLPTAAALLRRLVGIDPAGQGVALAGEAEVGMRVRFCRRGRASAARDLLRLCTQLRDELEQRRDARIAALDAGAGGLAGGAPVPARGAVYIACAARGEGYFGNPSGEVGLLRRQLGDTPLIGLFAAGEFARDGLHVHSGVLTLFGEHPPV